MKHYLTYKNGTFKNLSFVVGCDGTFLVRRSKNGGASSPYTLTLLYKQNMFHINIRAFSYGKFALGKSKVNEMVNTLLSLYMLNNCYLFM